MPNNSIYYDISKYYDLMYVNEETYQTETDRVFSIVSQYKTSAGNDLLDIACGTGAQAFYLQNQFNVTGIDISDEMLDIAKKKVKSAAFMKADMFNFNLEKQFDVIVSLYGAIGHAKTINDLFSAMKCVHKHLKQGGIFVATPFNTKESYSDALVVRSKAFDLTGFCRMETVKRLCDDKLIIEMHHLISTELDVKYHKYTQYISLFSEGEYVNSIQKAGLKILKRLTPEEFRMGAFICTI